MDPAAAAGEEASTSRRPSVAPRWAGASSSASAGKPPDRAPPRAALVHQAEVRLELSEVLGSVQQAALQRGLRVRAPRGPDHLDELVRRGPVSGRGHGVPPQLQPNARHELTSLLAHGALQLCELLLELQQ